MSGIPNDDESLELVERMLLLFHLPEFFQKEETKKKLSLAEQEGRDRRARDPSHIEK